MQTRQSLIEYIDCGVNAKKNQTIMSTTGNTKKSERDKKRFGDFIRAGYINRERTIAGRDAERFFYKFFFLQRVMMAIVTEPTELSVKLVYCS